jgi:hypothetical protein
MAEPRQDLEAQIGGPGSHRVSVVRFVSVADNGMVAIHRQIAIFLCSSLLLGST